MWGAPDAFLRMPAQCTILCVAVAATLLNAASAQNDTDSISPVEAPSAANATSRSFGDEVDDEDDDDGGLPISVGLLVALCIIGGCLLCCCYAAFHACIFYRTYGWIYEWVKWGKDMVFGQKGDEAGDGKTGWAAAPWNSGNNNNGSAAPWNTGGGGGALPAAGAVVGSLMGNAAPWSREVELPNKTDSKTEAVSATEVTSATEAAKPAAEP